MANSPQDDRSELTTAYLEWAREGRTEEQTHGAVNFITSRHFKDWATRRENLAYKQGWDSAGIDELERLIAHPHRGGLNNTEVRATARIADLKSQGGDQGSA